MEKEQQLDIWSFQWSSNSPSSECVPRPGEHFCVPVCWLIDNKSVSSLIKCPMPVIELHGDARERHNFFLLFTLKVNTKQRHVDTQCWKNIFDISFHEVSQKYALCLRSRQRAFLLPFASSHMFISTEKKTKRRRCRWYKSQNRTSELCCQPGGLNGKPANVLTLVIRQIKRDGAETHKKIHKSINLLKRPREKLPFASQHT